MAIAAGPTPIGSPLGQPKIAPAGQVNYGAMTQGASPANSLAAATGLTPGPMTTDTGSMGWAPGSGPNGLPPPPAPTPAGTVNYGTGTQTSQTALPGTVPAVQMPTDTTRETFARAKDTAGQNLAGTLKAIRGNANARGLAGSTAEEAGTNTAILGAGQTLADAATADAAEYAKEQEQAAELGYQGAVTQRGQDISALEESRGQDIGAYTTTRGQDIGEYETTRGQDIGSTESANQLAEREWEAQNANTLSQQELAMQQQGQGINNLSALSSLLSRIMPQNPPIGAPAEMTPRGAGAGGVARTGLY